MGNRVSANRCTLIRCSKSTPEFHRAESGKHRGCKRGLLNCTNSEAHGFFGQILLTANTLYDAVEPKAIWKPLFVSLKEEITSGGPRRDSTDMVIFILRTFYSEDEEIRSLHLPLVFSALVENLEVSLNQPFSFRSLTLFFVAVHREVVLREDCKWIFPGRYGTLIRDFAARLCEFYDHAPPTSRHSVCRQL